MGARHKPTIERMAPDRESTTVYLSRRQLKLLRALSGETKVPIAEYIRSAIDAFLEARGAISPENIPGPPLPRSVKLCANPTHGVWCCRDAA